MLYNLFVNSALIYSIYGVI